MEPIKQVKVLKRILYAIIILGILIAAYFLFYAPAHQKAVNNQNGAVMNQTLVVVEATAAQNGYVILPIPGYNTTITLYTAKYVYDDIVNKLANQGYAIIPYGNQTVTVVPYTGK